MRVTLVAAMSADGKIAPVARTAHRFGATDFARLERCCAAADALILGGGTLRAHGTTVSIRDQRLLAERAERGQPPQPTTCLVTAGGELSPDLPFFARQAVPRVVATTDGSAPRLTEQFGNLAEIWPCGAEQVSVDRLLDRFAAAGCREVALLGGGRLNAAFAAARRINRLELTIAPVLFGGAAAPTWLDGDGLPAPAELLLTAWSAVDGCLFASYDVSW